MSINVIGSISFGVGAAASAFLVAVVVERDVSISINVMGARTSLVTVGVDKSLGSVINVIGARSSLDVALVSVVVVLGNVPLVVGRAVTVTVKVVVTVIVGVLRPWDQDFVPQCASRLKTSGVRRSRVATRAMVEGTRGKKRRDFMVIGEGLRISVEAKVDER
jgi:hypothetical protein